MLMWETHMCYSEMRSPNLEYVTLVLEVTTMSIFCVEELHWKIITFIDRVKISWNAFMRYTRVTLKWEALVWDMSKYCLTLEQGSFSL